MLQLHHAGAALSTSNANANSSSVSSTSTTATTVISSNSNVATNSEIIVPDSGIIPVTSVVYSSNNPPPVLSSLAHQPQQEQHTSPPPPDNAVGCLRYELDILYITEPCTIIGRNSSTSNVHFHISATNLVSRQHFQILYDAPNRDFYVQCFSKNGIFVGDFLQRRNADPLKLPPQCTFRFPSTEIRIGFESFVQSLTTPPSPDVGGSGTTSVGSSSIISAYQNNDQHRNALNSNVVSSVGSTSGGNPNVQIVKPTIIHADDGHHSMHHHKQQQQQQHPRHLVHPQQQFPARSHLINDGGVGGIGGGNASNVSYTPLKISIPKKEHKSPYLSPTGTISAANSCPASPRQTAHQSNQSNYGNNNGQGQDLFQTPSTASYNHNEKPPYSYAQLIVQAISAAPDKQLTLSGIYSFIVKHYPYYRKETNKGWQNSIRHNLSLNRYFIKVARSQDEPGKGSFWRIDPDSGAKLIDHSYKKRRQRSSQGFRSSYGMPRSAPVSPSHMDNSRENSPLQDIVLQSAPGSPGISLENRAQETEIIYNPTTNTHHTVVSANNVHNQSGSTFYVTNQNTVIEQHQQQNHEGGPGGINNSGNSVGALIAVKRNHTLVLTGPENENQAINMHHHHHQPQQHKIIQHQQQQQHHHLQQQQHHQQQQLQQKQQQIQHQQQQIQQQQPLHPDIIYEELPTDYSGNIDSTEECDGNDDANNMSVPASDLGGASPMKRRKYYDETL